MNHSKRFVTKHRHGNGIENFWIRAKRDVQEFTGECSGHGSAREAVQKTRTLQGITFTGKPGCRVSSDNAIPPEFMIENHGNQTHPNVCTNLHLNKWWYQLSDTRIGCGSCDSIQPVEVHTTTIPVIILNNIKSGSNYWMAIIVDTGNDINEVSGSNNRAYIPVRVQ
ncbi:hypothetical protein [Candidatus Nitrospira salsa]